MEIQQYDALSFVTFAPEQLGVYFGDANSTGRLTRTKANEVLAQPGVLAVLDGPMYGACTGVPRCAQLEYLYLDQRAGEYFPGRHPERGMTVEVKADGRVVVAHGASTASDPVVAVQLYPELVWEGRNVASTSIDTSRVWRAALGVLPGGKMVLVVGIAPMHQFADLLIALGVIYAGYTDGGGSASLQVRGGHRVGSTEDRPVASWIVVRGFLPESSPLVYLDRLTHGATVFGWWR